MRNRKLSLSTTQILMLSFLVVILAGSLLLALPVNLLCSDDCAGLCPQCGADRNEVECGCEPPEIAVPEPEDNPWAALDDLKLQ